MSIPEEAARLSSLADKAQITQNLLETAQRNLDAVAGEVSEILGSGSERAAYTYSAITGANEGIETALVYAQQAVTVIREAAEHHGR